MWNAMSACGAALELPVFGKGVASCVPAFDVFRWGCVSTRWRDRWQREDVWLHAFHADLSHRHIGDRGAQAVGSRIPAGLTSLSLNFAWCDITEGGARAVAERVPAGLTQLP